MFYILLILPWKPTTQFQSAESSFAIQGSWLNQDNCSFCPAYSAILCWRAPVRGQMTKLHIYNTSIKRQKLNVSVARGSLSSTTVNVFGLVMCGRNHMSQNFNRLTMTFVCSTSESCSWCCLGPDCNLQTLTHLWFKFRGRLSLVEFGTFAEVKLGSFNSTVS